MIYDYVSASQPKAVVANLHEAFGQDMREEAAQNRDGVEGGGAWARTARLAVGDGEGQ